MGLEGTGVVAGGDDKEFIVWLFGGGLLVIFGKRDEKR